MPPEQAMALTTASSVGGGVALLLALRRSRFERRAVLGVSASWAMPAASRSAVRSPPRILAKASAADSGYLIRVRV